MDGQASSQVESFQGKSGTSKLGWVVFWPVSAWAPVSLHYFGQIRSNADYRVSVFLPGEFFGTIIRHPVEILFGQLFSIGGA